jgi:hypothetical protein
MLKLKLLLNVYNAYIISNTPKLKLSVVLNVSIKSKERV